jgi:hypothetical protein
MGDGNQIADGARPHALLLVMVPLVGPGCRVACVGAPDPAGIITLYGCVLPLWDSHHVSTVKGCDRRAIGWSSVAGCTKPHLHEVAQDRPGDGEEARICPRT